MAGAIQPRAGFAAVEGGQLWYEVAGEGHPLLLIHAGIADSRMWDEQFRTFAEHYRVVRYDTRGFGQSKTKNISFSNRQDIADLFRHLGIERSYILGISRGGTIAIDFALEYPEMVDALIVVSSGLSGYTHQPTEAARLEMQLFDKMAEAAEQGDFARLVDLEMQMWVDGPGQPSDRVAPHIRERVREMDAANYNRQDGEARPRPLHPPAIRRLAKIQVPTLVIVGDLDASGVQAAADILAQRIAGARKVVFQGAAHMVNMEQPEEFNRVVLDFLSSIGKQ
jgi:3-oxoadipate enol-lactonase